MSDLKIVDEEVGGELAKPASAVEQFNPEFEGLSTKQWADRVVIDGSQFLYKDEDTYVDELAIKLRGGRNVWQFFIEESNTFIKSYDGKITTDGEPLSKYPGARLMYELDWLEMRGDEEREFQLVLSPTGRYAFIEYINALMSECGLKLADVVTKARVKRKQNRDGKRYGKPLFTCDELTAKGWEPSDKDK